MAGKKRIAALPKGLGNIRTVLSLVTPSNRLALWHYTLPNLLLRHIPVTTHNALLRARASCSFPAMAHRKNISHMPRALSSSYPSCPNTSFRSKFDPGPRARVTLSHVCSSSYPWWRSRGRFNASAGTGTGTSPPYTGMADSGANHKELLRATRLMIETYMLVERCRLALRISKGLQIIKFK